MARDYLAIPGVLTSVAYICYLVFFYKLFYSISATSATVERIFSGGTDLVAQRRCSLQGETIQEFMCLKGWWKSGLKEQEDCSID